MTVCDKKHQRWYFTTLSGTIFDRVKIKGKEASWNLNLWKPIFYFGALILKMSGPPSRFKWKSFKIRNKDDTAEGIGGRQDQDATGNEHERRNEKGIGKRDAKKQSRWRKLDMTAKDKSGTRNERELREKVAGRKLGSTEVKEHV